MYYYRSPVGTFRIRLQRGRYVLSVNDEVLGFYGSAVAAADDVYLHVTGYTRWDRLDGKLRNVPTDIFEWATT